MLGKVERVVGGRRVERRECFADLWVLHYTGFITHIPSGQNIMKFWAISTFVQPTTENDDAF